MLKKKYPARPYTVTIGGLGFIREFKVTGSFTMITIDLTRNAVCLSLGYSLA